MAQAKVQADADYDAKITANLQRLAKVADVNLLQAKEAEGTFRGETRKSFHFKVGDSRYCDVTTSANDCSLKLDTLSVEQAEHIIRYLKGIKKEGPWS